MENGGQTNQGATYLNETFLEFSPHIENNL